jgi:hypothetical protein
LKTPLPPASISSFSINRFDELLTPSVHQTTTPRWFRREKVCSLKSGAKLSALLSSSPKALTIIRTLLGSPTPSKQSAQ